ncbi:hypothetical protein HRbin19_01526 [bacterium HR19]|nr:hypothetical protein HRbin19_01526 [bacterium HR19]
MRLSVDDIEKIFEFVSKFLRNFKVDPSIFESAIEKLINFLRLNERTVVSRIKLRISKMIDELEEKDKKTKEDKIKIKTLMEIMRIIDEEERKL